MTLWLALLLAFAPFQAKHTKPKPKPKPARTHHATKPSPKVGIQPARATVIEQALVDHGYLKRVSGHWDAAAAAAMKKFQKDHHWQTRYVPDSRALIALGLGPHPDTDGASGT